MTNTLPYGVFLILSSTFQRQIALGTRSNLIFIVCVSPLHLLARYHDQAQIHTIADLILFLCFLFYIFMSIFVNIYSHRCVEADDSDIIHGLHKWCYLFVAICRAKSRKYRGVFEVKSRVKAWQVRGIWSQQLEH